MTRQSAAEELAAYLRNSPDLRIADLGGLNLDADALERNAGSLGAAEPEPVGRVSQSIVLPYPVSANRYWRHYNGRTVVSEDARAYKAGVWLQAQHAGMRPFAGPIAMYVHVYRARKVGDLDNSAKVLADSLNGIAYQDDSQIVEWHLWRHDDPRNPRVEVEIRKVQP